MKISRSPRSLEEFQHKVISEETDQINTRWDRLIKLQNERQAREQITSLSLQQPGHLVNPGNSLAGQPFEAANFYSTDLVFSLVHGISKDAAKQFCPKYVPLVEAIWYMYKGCKLIINSQKPDFTPGKAILGIADIGLGGLDLVGQSYPLFKLPEEISLASNSIIKVGEALVEHKLLTPSDMAVIFDKEHELFWNWQNLQTQSTVPTYYFLNNQPQTLGVLRQSPTLQNYPGLLIAPANPSKK